MSPWQRTAILLLLLAGCVLPAASGANYTALVIRRPDPPDYFLMDKFKINDKDELYRITVSAPLSQKQYEKLPKLSLAEVRWFRVEGGVLRVRAHNRAELLALPRNYKRWDKAPLEPSTITRGSTFDGQLVNSKGSFSPPVTEGWTVYVFPARPPDDAVAFALAETRDSEEGWRKFLQEFPGSIHASVARELLGTAYLGRAQQALNRYQQALEKRQRGYTALAEARHWLEQLRAVNYQTPAGVEAEAALNRLEGDKANRLRQARLFAENDDFDAADQLLAPLLHFQDEYPELASELVAIRELRARYHANEARRLLGDLRFEDALREVEAARAVQALPELPALEEEIKSRRAAHERKLEIDRTMAQVKQAMDRADYGHAFDTLWPLAIRYPEEKTLQESFVALRRIYSSTLLGDIAQEQELHTPIRGPADEEVLLRLHSDLTRLGQFEPDPALAVWRDRLSLQLAAYYQKRAEEVTATGGEGFPALAFAFFHQARHFMLDKAEMADYTSRRAHLEEQLGVGVALSVRDLTPEAGGQYLVAELSIALGDAIQKAGFPNVQIFEAGRSSLRTPTLEFVVELLSAGVREAAEAEMVPSQYSAGLRQVPNPAWRTAKEAYDRAVEAYEEVRARVERDRRQKKYNKRQREADDAALARADAGRQQAKKALDALPAFVEQEDIRPYEFTRRTISRSGEMRVAYRWVNALTGVREAQQIMEEREPVQGVEVTGVHPADKNGNRNQPASLPEAAVLRGRVLRKMQDKLAALAREHLKSFIERDLERAQQEAERGNSDTAAEYYLRFLFNGLPDDARRAQGVEFLEQQYRLVSLGEWLQVPGSD
jgi:hypothetical protein